VASRDDVSPATPFPFGDIYVAKFETLTNLEYLRDQPHGIPPDISTDDRLLDSFDDVIAAVESANPGRSLAINVTLSPTNVDSFDIDAIAVEPDVPNPADTTIYDGSINGAVFYTEASISKMTSVGIGTRKPSTFVLAFLGLLSLGMARRRRRL